MVEEESTLSAMFSDFTNIDIIPKSTSLDYYLFLINNNFFNVTTFVKIKAVSPKCTFQRSFFLKIFSHRN